MSNGCGYIADEPDARDRPMGTPLAPRRGGNLRRHVRAILAQRKSSSCVAQWLACSLAILGVANGKPWALVSRLYIYYWARVALGPYGRDVDGKLADVGCRPRDALRALRRLGAPPETRFKFSDSPEKLKKKPGLWLRMLGVDLRFEYRRCSSVAQIQAALADGYPVGIGLDIDAAFQDANGPGVITQFDDVKIGGHMLTIVADDVESNTAVLLNSWGEHWRDHGTVKMTWALIAKELRKTDAWAIIQ